VELQDEFGEALTFAQESGWLHQLSNDNFGILPGRFSRLPQVRALFYPSPALEWLSGREAAEPRTLSIV
jgi:hypothetical protein